MKFKRKIIFCGSVLTFAASMLMFSGQSTAVFGQNHTLKPAPGGDSICAFSYTYGCCSTGGVILCGSGGEICDC